MAQGLAVTWDNPDVTIELSGVPVDAHDLKPATTYDVIARVWNSSTDAPAVGLPVLFSYLSFGISTTRIPIPGATLVDLGVKGSPNCSQAPGEASGGAGVLISLRRFLQENLAIPGCLEQPVG
jgi:hypothetical protein